VKRRYHISLALILTSISAVNEVWRAELPGTGCTAAELVRRGYEASTLVRWLPWDWASLSFLGLAVLFSCFSLHRKGQVEGDD